MSKEVLIEKSGSSGFLKLESSEKSQNCLGKLRGICADFMNPTRNGRIYSKELWEKVIASDEFKEGMATRTIFGENDHPETRADTSIKEISVVLTDLQFNESNGTLDGSFDILDTPQGRILKTLVDYGCNLGVSSRGLGEEVIRNGVSYIDEDTYEFFAFDVVVTPAVKAARPQKIESLTIPNTRATLTESIIREINDATSSAELESIVRIAENAQVPDLDSIKESVDNKLNLMESNNIAPLQEDLEAISKENVSLKSKISKLESKKSNDNIRMDRMRGLIKNYKENSSKLSENLQKSKVQVSNLEKSLLESANENEKLSNNSKELDEQLDREKRVNLNLKEQVARLTSQLDYYKKQANESESRSKDLSKENDKLVAENSKLKDDNKKLKVNMNESLKSNNAKLLDESKKAEAKNKQLTEKVSRITKYAQKATLEYLKTKCKMYNLDPQVVRSKLPDNYKLEDIDNTVVALAKKQDRINKLPVDIHRSGMVLESIELSSRTISDEDKQTMSILESTQKSI